MAKFRFAPELSKPAVVIPITWPYSLINAPPLLPWSIGTLIWMILSPLNWDISPDEKVFSKPNGLPIAYTFSPTFGLIFPKGIKLKDKP